MRWAQFMKKELRAYWAKVIYESQWIWYKLGAHFHLISLEFKGLKETSYEKERRFYRAMLWEVRRSYQQMEFGNTLSLIFEDVHNAGEC